MVRPGRSTASTACWRWRYPEAAQRSKRARLRALSAGGKAEVRRAKPARSVLQTRRSGSPVRSFGTLPEPSGKVTGRSSWAWAPGAVKRAAASAASTTESARTNLRVRDMRVRVEQCSSFLTPSRTHRPSPPHARQPSPPHMHQPSPRPHAPTRAPSRTLSRAPSCTPAHAPSCTPARAPAHTGPRAPVHTGPHPPHTHRPTRPRTHAPLTGGAQNPTVSHRIPLRAQDRSGR